MISPSLRGRMRILLLLAALLAAGCAGDPAPRADGPIGGVSIHTPQMPDAQETPPPREPARDPEAPPVTRNGTPSHAMSLLVRERTGESERHPCGGAVLATLPGAYVGALPEVEYAESHLLADPSGREWLTDRYVDPAQPDNATRSVWVANVGGQALFRRDEGAHCEAPTHEDAAFNVLLFADVDGELEVRYQPDTRPRIPVARDYP